MKRHILYLLAAGMILALLPALILDRGGAGHGMTGPAEASGLSSPLAQPTATISGNEGPLEIEFDTVLNVPDEFRQPVEDAMVSGRSQLTGNRFTVTALRSSGDWMQAILVPTYVVESVWEVELRPNDIVEVLGRRDGAGGFSAYLRGTTDFAALALEVPQNFIDFSSPSDIAPTTVGYLFPWTSGQNWYKTQGWHSGNAIDFQPVVRSSRPIHDAVLAAAPGRLTEVCNDGYQSALRVEHADGNTQYLHLDVNAVRRDLLGQNVVRGQFLGLLYNGTQGGRWYNGHYYKFWTRCGYGTGTHLHFVLPRRDLTIDGHNANNVANSRFATQYRSSNERTDGGGTTPNCADGEGAILYEHTNYAGRCTRFTGDDNHVGDNPIGNDAASSIRIIGNFEAVVCEHDDYGGTCSTFTGDDPDFGNDAIGHDRASSIRVRRRDSGGSSNCDGGHGVYLYEHTSYNGRCSKFTGDSPNPRNWYIGNDTASSIRIIGNYEATVYEHDDYHGASSTFTGDDPDFGNDTIGHDRASSIRVRQRDGGGNSNCDGGQGVYLYEHASYNGRCSKFTSDSPNPRNWYIGNDAASSIRIIGNYEATVYEHDDYHGASSTFTGDDPDFGNDTIGHDRASSIRVRQRASGPTHCDDGQFLAEYFSNRNLSGSPAFRRCERTINTDWAYRGPGHGVGNDNFSIRWRGRFWFNEGHYKFRTRTDDGVRFWLDGRLLIDRWRDMGATAFTVERTLSAGMHALRMEFYEHGGYATARLSWQRQQSATDPDDGRTIGYGQGLDGTVNPARDRDDYYFAGSAGQTITIRMDKRNSNLDTYVELYNPDGTLLGHDDDGGVGYNSRLAITLRQNGRHKVIAHGYGSSTGGYRLSLSRESTDDPDDSRWIAFGSTLQGTISPNNDRDWYYFSTTAGRVVSIRMNKIDSGLDSYLELYDSSGAKIAQNDDGGGNRNAWLVHTLPGSGVYRIVARSWALRSSGRYNLALSLASNTNLALGKGARATSTEFHGVEPYKAFDGHLNTRWSSRFSDPQFIYVDLGATYTFDQVVLRWETAYARRYGIYYWTGSAWRNVYWTDNGNGGNDTITFSPVRARYVGMYGIQRGTSWGYSLWEFEVYNTADVAVVSVPPDPGDKPAEGDIPPSIPVPPNDPSKLTELVGEGASGQEDTPLAGVAEVAPAGDVSLGSIPSAHILYPVADAPPGGAQDIILFQGVASDNDEDGAAIVAYEWRSDRDGLLGDQQVFTMTRLALSPGAHVISFRAQDDEGDWSEWDQVTIQVSSTPCYDFVEPSPVGVEDLQAAANVWRRHSDDAGWDARFDLDGDGVINIADIMRLAAAWGSTCE